MIQPEQIRKKALRLWQSGKVLRAIHDNEAVFPWSIPTAKPNAKTLLNNFSSVLDWVTLLRQNQHYDIELTTINHRQLGQQEIPRAIVFTDAKALIRYLGVQQEADCFEEHFKQLTARYPTLRLWCLQHPFKLIENDQRWPRLMRVLQWFEAHPRANCYIREIDIETVDSKFIEQHRGLLSELLDIILPASAIEDDVQGLSKHGFERRYGLKYDQPLIRFRILDEALSAQYAGINDITLPLEQFHQLKPAWQHVFITENKINGLSFPAMKNTIVIFGLGYGIAMLKQVAWLKHCDITYWGDIDTHGFAILSQLRGFFAHTQSVMMDEKTLLTFHAQWVTEKHDKRCTHALEQLSHAEEKLYLELVNNHHAPCLRLEQEHIAFGWVVEQIMNSQENVD